MEERIQWRNDLKKLPAWAQDSLAYLGGKYDYIAYRLAERVEDFNIELQEVLEKKLPGTTDPNCDVKLNEYDQRVAFFISLIRYSDYYRPTNLQSEKIIPDSLKPKSRPTVSEDLKEHVKLRELIGQHAKDLSSLLKQYGEISKRLNVVEVLECNPLDLIRSVYSKGNIQFLDGIEKEFNHVSARMRHDFNPTFSFALLTCPQS